MGLSQHDDDTWRGEPTTTGERANFERYHIFVQLIVAIQKVHKLHGIGSKEHSMYTVYVDQRH